MLHFNLKSFTMQPLIHTLMKEVQLEDDCRAHGRFCTLEEPGIEPITRRPLYLLRQ